jgi:hypothetical protein
MKPLTTEEHRALRASIAHGHEAYERVKHLPHIAHNIRMREMHERVCIGLCRGVSMELLMRRVGRSAMDARVVLWMMAREGER